MVNLKEAPEGTTHYSTSIDAIQEYGPWRKFEDGQWFYYKNGWVFRSDSPNYLQLNPHLRELKPQDAELPDGLQWPEGMTHYNPNNGGFFFNKEGYARPGHQAVNHWIGLPGVFQYWEERPDTIARSNKVVAKAETEQEVIKPKKAVGWW